MCVFDPVDTYNIFYWKMIEIFGNVLDKVLLENKPFWIWFSFGLEAS